jgi:hypothetical protein
MEIITHLLKVQSEETNISTNDYFNLRKTYLSPSVIDGEEKVVGFVPPTSD